MSLSLLEQQTISHGIVLARKLLTEVKPLLDSLVVTYDAAGGCKQTITQEDLDSNLSYSGLTKQQLDDAMYALTALLLPGIEQAYTALAHLGARLP